MEMLLKTLDDPMPFFIIHIELLLSQCVFTGTFEYVLEKTIQYVS